MAGVMAGAVGENSGIVLMGLITMAATVVVQRQQVNTE
jgi:NaMN:DMB phosphoribosyltransferase